MSIDGLGYWVIVTVTDIPEKKWDFPVFAIFGPSFFFEKGDFLVQKPGFLNKNPSFFFPKAGFRPKTGIFKNRDIGNPGLYDNFQW